MGTRSRGHHCNSKGGNGAAHLQLLPRPAPLATAHHHATLLKNPEYMGEAVLKFETLCGLSPAAFAEYQLEARRRYEVGRKNALGQFVFAHALHPASGLGGTQGRLAARLGKHVSVVSVGLNHGEVSAESLADLLSNSYVATRFCELRMTVRCLMSALGFVEALRYVGEIVGMPRAVIERMTLANYEVVCGIVTVRTDDNFRRPLTAVEIATLASRFRDQNLAATHTWLPSTTLAELSDLRDRFANRNFVATYVAALELEWIPAFAFAFGLVENKGCDLTWDHF